tara:strand:- start:2377 stop:2886 length:510 start_codon:yes stop_codon:yes gene_type:complete
MLIEVEKNLYMTLPDKMEWFMPYIVAMLDNGYRFPQKITMRMPPKNGLNHLYGTATAPTFFDVFEDRIVPCSSIFIYSHDYQKKGGEWELVRLQKRTLLCTLAHEFAHIQKESTFDHTPEWEAMHENLLKLFALVYGKPLKIQSREWENRPYYKGQNLWVSHRGIFKKG